ncbi:Uncharacterised protein [Vibrio cholerae]|nr:Uncharacterised protein [Vibrio cholerae]
MRCLCLIWLGRMFKHVILCPNDPNNGKPELSVLKYVLLNLVW